MALVLVVEDEESFSDALSYMLRKVFALNGIYTLTAAANRANGNARVTAAPPRCGGPPRPFPAPGQGMGFAIW